MPSQQEITQQKIRTISLVIALLLALMLIPGVTYVTEEIFFGSEDYEFAPQWDEAFLAADRILALRGFCTTKQACAEKSVSIYVFGYSNIFKKGFNVEIYGTSDQALIDELQKVFVAEFDKTPSIKNIKIVAFSMTHQQYLTILNSKQKILIPVRQLHVER